MKDLKVINLIAPPGAGKSTIAAGLFASLKMDHLNVELVPEYAKTIVWWDRTRELEDQLYITAKQNHKQFMLIGKADLVVTDSSIILGLLYQPTWWCDDLKENFKGVVKCHLNSYDNKFIFIERNHEYDPKGRNQTEEEAKNIEVELKLLLTELGIEYTVVKADENSVKNIREDLGDWVL